MCEFEPDDDLFRGIRPEWWSNTDDRPTSAGFQDDEMSVDWCKYSTARQSFDRYKRMSGLSNAALVSIKVQDVISLRQKIKYDPCTINGEYNSAHTLVIGKKNRTIARRFAREFAKVILEFRL